MPLHDLISIEVSKCFAKQVERYKDRLERIWSKGDTYVKSKSGNEWRWTNLANGIAISSEEVAILQSKKSTESQQLSDGHRQAVKKMVLNNVINVSKKLEKLGAGGPGGWLARTVNERLAHSGCYDFGSIDLAMVIWRSRPSGGFFCSLLDTSQCDSAILIIALSIKMCSASSSSMNSSLEVSRGESLGESTIDVVEALKKGFDKMMVLSPSKEEHFDFKRDCTDLKENCTYIFMENFEQEDADFFLSLKEEDASAIRCSTPVNGDNNVSLELMDVIDREATMNNKNVRNVGVYSKNELPLHIKSQLQIFKIIF
ncbi:hypothetical protein T09_12013 [Trichinella sp. T9]|nr:hypothetical protein T09_12013 [Trichinella sp. T9]